jgi:stage II sporulation protein D
MFRKLLFIQFVLILFSPITSGQARVRIFANKPASSGVFTVTAGKYELDVYDGKTLSLSIGEPVVLAMFNGKIAVKADGFQSFMCDSLILRGLTGKECFSFRANGSTRNRQFYSGALQCNPDLGILVFINICDIEQYIGGVVRTEGGTGRNIEYLKSQAVLARTFMYKHISRHLIDEIGRASCRERV